MREFVEAMSFVIILIGAGLMCASLITVSIPMLATGEILAVTGFIAMHISTRRRRRRA